MGRMGSAMAGTLSRAGFPTVLWNRSEAKARSVAAATGGTLAATPALAAQNAEIVLTSLADDAAVREVYLAEAGVVSGVGPGHVVVETSTIDPETVIEIGEAVDATGAALIDCPVSGSVATVEAGALTVMAGGDPAAIDRAMPVLEALSSRVVPTGPRASGAATKLAVNALVHGLNIALSEALVLAEAAGVGRSVAYDVFASGAGGAPFVQYKRESYEHPDTAPVAFSLDLVAKDLELITGLAARAGAPMAQAETGLAIIRNAIAAGLGDHDMSAVAVYLRGEDA